jgi:hypothetical protein
LNENGLPFQDASSVIAESNDFVTIRFPQSVPVSTALVHVEYSSDKKIGGDLYSVVPTGDTVIRFLL